MESCISERSIGVVGRNGPCVMANESSLLAEELARRDEMGSRPN